MFIILIFQSSTHYGYCLTTTEDDNKASQRKVLFIPIVETILELKKQMNRWYWKILCRTPFTHFTDVSLVMQERRVLDALLQVYNDRNQHFKIGESILPFKVEDVALILGLCCDGDIVSFKHKMVQSKFEQTFLNKIHNRHHDVIKENLTRLVCNKNGEEKTLVKLLVVYFMMTVFFPNTSLNAPTFTTSYVDDLASLGHYAWAHDIHRQLIGDVPLTTIRVQLWCKGKYTTMGYLKGCVLTLIIQFYEVTCNVKKLCMGQTPSIICYEETSFIIFVEISKRERSKFVIFLCAMFGKCV